MEDANKLKELGNSQFKAGNFGQAIEMYTQAIKMHPDATFYSNRAACFAALKKYNEVIEDCEEALKLDNKFVKVYLRAGTACIKLGRLNEAQKYLSDGLAVDPKEKALSTENDTLLLLISYKNNIDHHIASRDFADASRKLDLLIDKCELSYDLYRKKVEVLCFMGDTQKAMAFLREKEYTFMNYNESMYQYLQALVARYKNAFEEAKRYLLASIRRDPDNDLLKSAFKLIKLIEETKQKADTLFKQLKYKEASDTYEEVLNLDPHNKLYNSVILSNQATCYMSLKDNAQALKLLKKAVEYNPKNAKAFFKKAEVEFNLEDYESAEQSIRRAKTIDPSLNLNERLKNYSQLAKKAKQKDFYKILDIQKTATPADIKKAYRKMAMKYHPDKNQGSKEEQDTAEKKFKEISEAYNVLSDENKKQRYDMGAYDPTGSSNDFSHGHNFGDMFGGDDHPVFQMFFGPGSSNSFNFRSQQSQSNRSNMKDQFFSNRGDPFGFNFGGFKKQ